MRFRLPIIVACIVAGAALAAGCGGGNGGSSNDGGSRGTATPDAFDPNILSAIVLGPDDVPRDLPGVSGEFNENITNGLSFNTVYGGKSLYVQSTVGRIADKSIQASNFDRVRRSLAALVKGEQNYNVEGADRGFVYQGADPPNLTGLVFKGDFLVLIVMQSQDKTRTADATDRATLDKYMNLVFGRLQQYLADPTSLTPIPDARKFGTPTPNSSAATGTPAAAATPTP